MFTAKAGTFFSSPSLTRSIRIYFPSTYLRHRWAALDKEGISLCLEKMEMPGAGGGDQGSLCFTSDLGRAREWTSRTWWHCSAFWHCACFLPHCTALQHAGMRAGGWRWFCEQPVSFHCDQTSDCGQKKRAVVSSLLTCCRLCPSLAPGW